MAPRALPPARTLLRDVMDDAMDPADLATVPVLEAETVAELASISEGVNPGFLRELITIYRRQAPTLVRQLVASADTGDLAAVQAAAHRLRGSSVTLGAARMAEACRRLEQRAQAGDGAAVERLAACVPELLEVLDAALLDVLARQPLEDAGG